MCAERDSYDVLITQTGKSSKEQVEVRNLAQGCGQWPLGIEPVTFG